MKINFTTKILGSTLLLLAQTLAVEAAHLTPEQSLSRAESMSSVRRLPGNSSFSLAHSETVAGESMLYVFNKGDRGFIVTSADDRMPAVLGYSDSGAFNISNASPELNWWLSQYAAQAEMILKSATILKVDAPATRAYKASIPEMLSTRWDQDEPYNLDCPSDKGGKCVTGCVATAMAQVIKYYGYPVNGNGTASYNWQGETLSFDYSNANFDFQNMLDEYPRYADGATQEQKDAVAKLMYACGVSVNMNYTSDSSGASDIYIPYALKEYYKYDKDIQLLRRDYYSDEDWDNLVYSELAAGRPVIYGGQSKGGGHEFICDGYDEGYYHINWGWSGYGNGWFLLSSLDPGIQGIGGGIGGFDYDQSIISGIQPDAGNTARSYPIYSTGGLEALNVGYFGSNQAVMIGIINGGIWNYSPEEVSTSFYMKAVSDVSGEEYFSTLGYDVTFLAADDQGMSGYTALYCYIPSLPEGVYDTSVMYMNPRGELVPLMVPVGAPNSLRMTIDAKGIASFTNGDPEEKASVEVTGFEPIDDVVSGELATLKLTIQNTGNVTYAGPIYMQTYDRGSEEVLNSVGFSVTIGAGQSIGGTIEHDFNLPDGEYDVIFFDMYEEPCSEVFSLVIGVPDIVPTEISLDKSELILTEGDTYTFEVTINPVEATDKSVTWTSSDENVATIEDGVVTGIAPGTAVITASTVNGLTATCTVTVGGASVDAIMMEGGNADVFTPDGKLLRKNADATFLSTLAKGTYILRTSTKTVKIVR